MGEPTDLVLSYVVGSQGVLHDSDRELKAALAKGYRVLDVITTPLEVGPASAAHGRICVTVVLTQNTGFLPYKFFQGAGEQAPDPG
jgi:hypothetical protein